MQHLPVTANAMLQGFRVTRLIEIMYHTSTTRGPWWYQFTAADRNKVALRARTNLEKSAKELHANAILRYRLREFAVPGMIMAIASGRLVVVERLRGPGTWP